MASFHFLFSLALATFLTLSTFHLTDAQNGGFSVEIIHRDSPNSPFYNPLETRTQRIANAFLRSINRANRFNPTASKPNSIQSTVTSNRGEYLMSLSVGTPPFRILAIADTGSDLIWTQCKPCPQCYKQEDPLFDPAKSKTYKILPCSSDQCEALTGSSACAEKEPACQYTVSYGDGSHTTGDIAIDTLTLGSTTGRSVSFPKRIIGCGHDNEGTFDSKGSGIVGLGGGPESLVTQLHSSIDGKFSYCLVPLFSETKNSSKLNFGTKAVVSGAGTVSTPLVEGLPNTFYFLALEAISVGRKRLEFSDTSFQSAEGNIIIDSGTTLTLLQEDFYVQFEEAVAEVINLRRVDDPGRFLSLCYQTESDDFDVPNVTVHFKGAAVKLRKSNLFVRITEEIVCFAFGPVQSGSIYGNIAQINFLIGYDNSNNKLSIKPTDCTKL